MKINDHIKFIYVKIFFYYKNQNKKRYLLNYSFIKYKINHPQFLIIVTIHLLSL